MNSIVGFNPKVADFDADHFAADALGFEKIYVVDPRGALPDDWQDMRERKSLSKTSVSSVKWAFVKRFGSTRDCHEHPKKKRFVSVATSPHVRGKTNLFLYEGDYKQHTKLAVLFCNGKARH